MAPGRRRNQTESSRPRKWLSNQDNRANQPAYALPNDAQMDANTQGMSHDIMQIHRSPVIGLLRSFKGISLLI